MERILSMAMETADQAEVYAISTDRAEVAMRNGSVTEVSSGITGGVALRIIRGGIAGTAYASGTSDPARLVANATASLEAGVEARYSFPEPAEYPALDLWSEEASKAGFRGLSELLRGTLSFFGGRVDAQTDVSGACGSTTRRIMNSRGLDVSSRRSFFVHWVQVLFHCTETSVTESFHSLDGRPADPERLAEVVELYRRGLPECGAPTGRMKVLFHPNALHTLTGRILAATGAQAFHDSSSPLLDRVGERVASGCITFGDHPHSAGLPGATPFDDEGVATRTLPLIEGGVFRGRYTNLDLSARLGIEPTGSGYRSGSIYAPPSPALACEHFEPGTAGFDGMIASIDEGILLLGVLGAHSGNVMNGDFSVGMNPGLLVRNGSIVGRVRDGMVTGNVWDLLGRVEAVEDRFHNPAGASPNPCILVDGVSVAART